VIAPPVCNVASVSDLRECKRERRGVEDSRPRNARGSTISLEQKKTSWCCRTSLIENPLSAKTISQISLFRLPFLPFVLEPFFQMRLISRDGVVPVVAILPVRSYTLLKGRPVTGVELDEQGAALPVKSLCSIR
jgi:hypothetical protein